MAHDDNSFDSIFCGAIEIASSEDRAVFIARVCGSDEKLCRRVERLIDALTKSMELSDGGDGNDWFFLAKAHWQLGDKSQARFWYDKAVARMEKNQPKNQELIRFRAAAAALLRVKEKKD
jgi:tetratricopeptide (TPR) repeat protein